jgi:nicotinate-nucleotide--dimethylbenzimidazole phosphoribosyltransferase
VRRALALHSPTRDDPVGRARRGRRAGARGARRLVLGASALRVPVVLDGVIAGPPRSSPRRCTPTRSWRRSPVTAPRSPGTPTRCAPRAAPADRARPAAGEGSGAVLALPLVQSAARVLRDVATFDSAGVSDK